MDSAMDQIEGERHAGPVTMATPPAWMTVGLRGLARMTPEERRIAVENIEALVFAAYGDGPTPALRSPGSRERARVVLVQLGWADAAMFARVSAAEILTRLRTEIAAAGLL